MNEELLRQVADRQAITDLIYRYCRSMDRIDAEGVAEWIRTERVTVMIFGIMGALAALAGLVYAARLNSAQPKAGQGLELDVIAACFIGGAAVTGGVGKVTGVVIGAFIMGVMNNGMSIMGIGIDYQQVIKGLVLLSAVIFDVYNKNK